MSFLRGFSQGTQATQHEGTAGSHNERRIEKDRDIVFENGQMREGLLPPMGTKLGGDCTWKRHFKELFLDLEWTKITEIDDLLKDTNCSSNLILCDMRLPLCFYVICLGQGKDMLKPCALSMNTATQLELKRYMDDFIGCTEQIETLTATYNYMSISEKALFWLRIANLFAALRTMLANWGLTELCSAFINGCETLLLQLEDLVADINVIKSEVEKSQKKWQLNTKFQKKNTGKGL